MADTDTEALRDRVLARLSSGLRDAGPEAHAIDLERRRTDVVAVRDQAFRNADHAIRYGQMGLQGLGLLNGVALFAFPAVARMIAPDIPAGALALPMAVFAGGVVLVFLAVIAAYYSFGSAAYQGHSTADMNDAGLTAQRLTAHGQGDGAAEAVKAQQADIQDAWARIVKFHRRAQVFEKLTVVFALGALGAFVAGAWSGLRLIVGA